MRESVSRLLWWLGLVGAFVFAYAVISYPASRQLITLTAQVKLALVGLVAALLMRSWWSLILIPAAVIAGIMLAGLTLGVIHSFRAAVAGAFIVETFTFGAVAGGAALGMIVRKLITRISRTSPSR